MNSVMVNTPNKSYEIILEDTFDLLPLKIKSLDKTYSKIMVISDDRVSDLYYESLKSALLSLSIPMDRVVFQAGEINKNYESINGFYEALIENKYDRKTLIIALGGGVVGDMAGFTAATYMRGVDFIQVPTTLLSQVDSSVGGKTGIDFKGYKNIVGAFYQPELVYINTSVLKTLPEEEFASGMGEALKHGFIQDKAYLDFMVTQRDAIQSLQHDAISQLIGRSCEIKASVVSQDEKEHGLRAILNFGHTIGHAVERLKDFKLLHGQCVAIGMIASIKLSVLKGDLTEGDLTIAEKLLSDYGLPTKVTGLNVEQIYEQLFYDKKTKDNTINIVMLDMIGSCYQNTSLSPDTIKEGLTYIVG